MGTGETTHPEEAFFAAVQKNRLELPITTGEHGELDTKKVRKVLLKRVIAALNAVRSQDIRDDTYIGENSLIINATEGAQFVPLLEKVLFEVLLFIHASQPGLVHLDHLILLDPELPAVQGIKDPAERQIFPEISSEHELAHHFSSRDVLKTERSYIVYNLYLNKDREIGVHIFHVDEVMMSPKRRKANVQDIAEVFMAPRYPSTTDRRGTAFYRAGRRSDTVNYIRRLNELIQESPTSSGYMTELLYDKWKEMLPEKIERVKKLQASGWGVT